MPKKVTKGEQFMADFLCHHELDVVVFGVTCTVVLTNDSINRLMALARREAAEVNTGTRA